MRFRVGARVYIKKPNGEISKCTFKILEIKSGKYKLSNHRWYDKCELIFKKEILKRKKIITIDFNKTLSFRH